MWVPSPLVGALVLVAVSIGKRDLRFVGFAAGQRNDPIRVRDCGIQGAGIMEGVVRVVRVRRAGVCHQSSQSGIIFKGPGGECGCRQCRRGGRRRSDVASGVAVACGVDVNVATVLREPPVAEAPAVGSPPAAQFPRLSVLTPHPASGLEDLPRRRKSAG